VEEGSVTRRFVEGVRGTRAGTGDDDESFTQVGADIHEKLDDGDLQLRTNLSGWAACDCSTN
jgi:hypothetical protein